MDNIWADIKSRPRSTESIPQRNQSATALPARELVAWRDTINW